MSTAIASLAGTTARHRPVALALLSVTLGLAILGWSLLALSMSAPVPSAWGFRGFPGIFAFSFGWIGYLIASRQPRNPIGWSVLVAGLLSAVQVAATEYASFTLFGAGVGLPGGPIGAWLNDWVWLPVVGLMTIPVFLFFPDGRLIDPRWRVPLWSGGMAIAIASLMFALAPGPMQTFGLENPFGVDSPLTAVGAGATGGRSISAAGVMAMALFSLSALASVMATGLRFRGSTGTERQQLKWFAVSAGVAGAAMVASFQTDARWLQVVLIAAMNLVPLSIGIAILRYRLYDIDTLINRAVVYGVLTAVLAGLYSASIGLFQRLFVSVTGEKSDAAIVITTLILASAFTPVKTLLQAAADRRFKSSGDARKQLESFRESLRLVSEAVDGGARRRRFVEEAVSAFHARGARLALGRGAALREERAGDWSAGVVGCDLVDAGQVVGRIELCARRDGAPYSPADVTELTKTAAVVARAYVLAERLAIARTPGG